VDASRQAGVVFSVGAVRDSRRVDFICPAGASNQGYEYLLVAQGFLLGTRKGCQESIQQRLIEFSWERPRREVRENPDPMGADFASSREFYPANALSLN
jgi:hypothetical protein